jgi:hypothetical protein
MSLFAWYVNVIAIGSPLTFCYTQLLFRRLVTLKYSVSRSVLDWNASITNLSKRSALERNECVVIIPKSGKPIKRSSFGSGSGDILCAVWSTEILVN